MPKITRLLAITAFEDVVSTLDDLPDDPDLVAALLTDLGLKGHQGLAGDCPLSRYCRGVVGPDIKARVRVGPVWTTFSWGRFEMSYEPKESAKLFVRRFDYGKYPQLVAVGEL